MRAPRGPRCLDFRWPQRARSFVERLRISVSTRTRHTRARINNRRPIYIPSPGPKRIRVHDTKLSKSYLVNIVRRYIIISSYGYCGRASFSKDARPELTARCRYI